jgi:hypothetical protein
LGSPPSIVKKSPSLNAQKDKPKDSNPESYIVHKISGRETVQGLALKYGVPVSFILIYKY